MNPKNSLIYAGLVAVFAGGAIWAGVPISMILLLGLFLACPLMMLFMHGGQGGGHAGHGVDPAAPGDHAGHQGGPVDGHDRHGTDNSGTRR